MKWLTRLILYPFLFTFIFVFAFFTKNAGQIDIVLFIRPLIVIWLVTAMAMWFVYKLSKDIHRAGLLVTLGLTCFFVFYLACQPILDLLPRKDSNPFALVILLLWILLFVGLGSRWLWNKLSKPMLLTFLLNLVLFIALLYPALQFVQFVLQKNADQGSSEDVYLTFHSEPPVELSGSQFPDIYIIILDAYGRSDVLREIYNVDNRPFLDELEQRGFFVASQSHSNYIQTPLSLSALLNFQYHGEWKIPESELEHPGFIKTPLQNNQVFSLLKNLGYTIISFETGFYFTDFELVDQYSSPYIRLNQIEELLLSLSPIRLLASHLDIKLPDYSFRTHVARLDNTLNGLKTIHSIPGHKLVFAHLMFPHPPFLFDRYGERLPQKYAYSLSDGDTFEGPPEEYYQGYREQVLFASKAILAVIDEILAESDSPPVILLQGDHGPRMFLSNDAVEKSCLFEQTGILNALYVPGVDLKYLNPFLSPVNSFRIVFNTYFNTNLELLPDWTFYSTQSRMEVMTQVTEIRDSENNCIKLFPDDPVAIYSPEDSNIH